MPMHHYNRVFTSLHIRHTICRPTQPHAKKAQSLRGIIIIASSCINIHNTNEEVNEETERRNR